uniref:KH domain-containing protein n=1 Tax=Ndongobacter massiliensis TaxID=1871025 RepID=UPI000930A15B|nr:KH domain-containing protein [Ndongobacter massiliensis]
MKALVEALAESLVDSPEKVEVQETREGGVVNLVLSVDAHDMGKVIGKQGRIANAMRQVLKACAIKENVKVRLDIAEE